jgi:hypothetical protein
VNFMKHFKGGSSPRSLGTSDIKCWFLRPERRHLCEQGLYPVSHPDYRVKHGSIWAVTPIAVTLCTDVFVCKTGSCSKTLFSKKVL